MDFFEKYKSIIVTLMIIIVILIGILSVKNMSTNNNISEDEILSEVSKVANRIQMEKANLKSSLQKEVTTEECLSYLEKSKIIDANNNIIISKLDNLVLMPNGIINYKQIKKGQVLLTDYYSKRDVKTVWSQDNSVNNNLVTIQVNDGKFVDVQEDDNFKVWKYQIEAFDDSEHGRFSYWVNENNDIISTEKVLYETASVNRVYTAVYNSEVSVEPSNRVSMNIERVNDSFVGVLEGMHYANDMVEQVYSLETRKFENYEIKGSTLEKIGIIFTLNKEKGTSQDFGCLTTGADVGYTTIFDRTKENLNTLVSYNYKNSGIIMISQAFNITMDAIKALNPEKGDNIYMKPFMLFSIDSNGYYINGDITYECQL